METLKNNKTNLAVIKTADTRWNDQKDEGNRKNLG